MRPKIAIAVFVVSVLAAAAVLLLPKPAPAPGAIDASQAADPPPDASAAKTAVPAVPRANLQSPAPATQASADQPADDADPLSNSPEAKHEAYVHARLVELQDLCMDTDDPASLDNILSDLGNRDPEIRQAAVAATVQYGSRDAIPRLEDAESQAEDPHERAAIADAVEFLQAPSLSELLAQQKSAAAAAAH